MAKLNLIALLENCTTVYITKKFNPNWEYAPKKYLGVCLYGNYKDTGDKITFEASIPIKKAGIPRYAVVCTRGGRIAFWQQLDWEKPDLMVAEGDTLSISLDMILLD